MFSGHLIYNTLDGAYFPTQAYSVFICESTYKKCLREE